MSELVIISVEELKKIVHNEVLFLTKAQSKPQQKYNTKQAANYLGIPLPTFRQHQYKIGGSKIGKHWFFTQEELDAYYDSNRRLSREEIQNNILK